MIPDLAKLDPRLAILAELSRRESFGGDLARELGLGFGTVYPALRDLEREGFIACRPAEMTPGQRGRPRIYYRLTDAGRVELRSLRARFRAWLGEDSDA
jgi:DNA-binding PadR family transcriptional regulator